MASLLASASFDTFVTSFFNFLNYYVWLIITDEGSVPEMRIWSILLMKSDIKWSIHLDLFLYFNHFTHLVSVTAVGHESPWGHMQPSSTVDFSWLIRSVSRAATIFVLKFIEIVLFWVYSPSLLASICFGTFLTSLFNFFSYFVWLRITDDGSVLEMGLWSILLSLFSYCKSQAFTLHTLWVFLQNICPKHIFRFSRGGGVNFNKSSSFYFHFVIQFRLLLSICGLHFWCPPPPPIWNCFLRPCLSLRYGNLPNSKNQS